MHLEKSKNFISIIYLGNFNPAILDKRFLEKNNIFNFIEEPIINKTPVFTNFLYRNLKIIIDLERFQIIEEKIKDFHNNEAIDLAYNYFKLLQFTPLRIIGINLNSNIEINNIINFIKKIDTKDILKFFNAKEYILTTEKLFNEDKESFKAFNLVLKIAEDKLIQVNINNINSNNYQFNYNFELRDLNKKPERITYIKDNFNEILNEYNKTINFLINEK